MYNPYYGMESMMMMNQFQQHKKKHTKLFVIGIIALFTLLAAIVALPATIVPSVVGGSGNIEGAVTGTAKAIETTVIQSMNAISKTLEQIGQEFSNTFSISHFFS